MGALFKVFNGVGQGWLWLTILLMPILALAGGLGFQASGFLIGASGFFAWMMRRNGAEYLRDGWPLWLLALALWAWVSSLWSPYDSEILGGNASILFGLVVALLFLPFIILNLSARMQRTLIWAIILSGLLGVALLLVDAASGFALSLWGDPVDPGRDPIERRSDAEMNLGRGQVSYAQLLWPVAALIMVKFKRGWILALAAFVGLIISAQLNDLSIIISTICLGALVAATAWWRPKTGLVLAFGLAAASLALAPLLGLTSNLIDVELMRKIPSSWEHRLRMWAYSWDLIQQAPLLGHGFDSSRLFDELAFRTEDGRNLTVISMHPHNIGLQIWLETGLVGVVMAVGMIAALLKTALKTCTGSARAFAVSGLVVTIATSGAVTVGVWQHWWWALIVLAVSFVVLVPQNVEDAPSAE